MTRLFKALKHAMSDHAIKEAGIERIAYKIRIENNQPCPERTSLPFLDCFELLDMKQVFKANSVNIFRLQVCCISP